MPKNRSNQTEFYEYNQKTEIKKNKNGVLKQTFKRTNNRAFKVDKGKCRTAAIILHRFIIYEEISRIQALFQVLRGFLKDSGEIDLRREGKTFKEICE